MENELQRWPWHVIGVGVDGSPASKKALRWAADYASLTGSMLRVITTWAVHVGLGWAPPFPEDFDPAEAAAATQQETIEEVLGAAPEIKLDRVVVEGHAAAVLIEASSEVDLLVVGNRGHGGFTGLLVGSVSESVVFHAHCPVLVIRR
jgi:nucleotide-binding universal stress UspA family protein